MKIKSYALVTGFLDDVEDEVKGLIDLGFQPFGAIVYAGDDEGGDPRFAREMVEYSTEDTA